MISLFLAWSILLFTSYTFGFIGTKFGGYFWDSKTVVKTQWNILDTVLIGICFLSGVLNVLHVFIPANSNMMFIILMLSVLYWFFDYKMLFCNGQKAFDYVMSLPKKYLLLFILLILVVTLFCTLYPRMTDTLYYHYQNLMWNNEYPTVPGLANLQPRFGFNSNLYLLTSAFGCYSLYNQFIFSVHTLVLVMFTVWIAGRTLLGGITLRKVIALFVFICFFTIYKIHITSVTSDFFANLLVLYLFLNIIIDEAVVEKKSYLFLILPIFIVTVKLSCAPIILLSLFALYVRNRKDFSMKSVISMLFIGLFIGLPWCYNTYLLTGYIFFPLPYFDFFNPDWKVPMHYLMEQKNFIQCFAKYPNNLDIQSIMNMKITEWLPIWWKSDMFYYNPISNRVFFFGLLISIPTGAVFCVVYWKKYLTLVVTWIICFITILVWFFNAPDFRFVYSFILTLVFITLLGLMQFLSNKIHINHFNKLLHISAYLLLLYLFVFSFRWIYYQRGNVEFPSLLEKPTPLAYTRNLKNADNFVEDTSCGFIIHRNSFSHLALLCYDYPLPSSSDFVGGIEMRGNTLEEGFRCKANAPLRRTY